MTINKLAAEALAIATQREKNGGAKVEDIMKHLAGEVVEATEARAEYYDYEGDIMSAEDYAEELADVIICALIASAVEGFDIGGAICRKMKKNAQRAAGKGDKV